jgi:hypothetical protein
MLAQDEQQQAILRFYNSELNGTVTVNENWKECGSDLLLG